MLSLIRCINDYNYPMRASPRQWIRAHNTLSGFVHNACGSSTLAACFVTRRTIAISNNVFFFALGLVTTKYCYITSRTTTCCIVSYHVPARYAAHDALALVCAHKFNIVEIAFHCSPDALGKRFQKGHFFFTPLYIS